MSTTPRDTFRKSPEAPDNVTPISYQPQHRKEWHSEGEQVVQPPVSMSNRFDTFITVLEATTAALTRLCDLLDCDADDLERNMEGRDNG